MNRRLFCSSLAVPAGVVVAAEPAKPGAATRLVVGFAAGSPPDLLARALRDSLAVTLGGAVVVDNRPGAGGQLAVLEAVRGPRDGSAVLITPMSMLALFPHTYRRLGYDAFGELGAITRLANFDYALAVGAAVPSSVIDARGLLAWFRDHPKEANIGSPAAGSALHVVVEMLGRAADGVVIHVPYRGSPQGILDLRSGTLAAFCSSVGGLAGQDGVRIVATTGRLRSPASPQAPTLLEQGLADHPMGEWYGAFVRVGTPPTSRERLHAAFTAALAGPAVQRAAQALWLTVAPSSAAELERELRTEHDRWGALVRRLGMPPVD